tara:strand:+ start:221 stop:412 length:192 start_codon:yes stop_codon:yes gene_type:complete
MRLHPSAVKRLLKIYDTYGGYREETKLRQQLENLELSAYKQQDPPNREVLVCTDELQEALRKL